MSRVISRAGAVGLLLGVVGLVSSQQAPLTAQGAAGRTVEMDALAVRVAGSGVAAVGILVLGLGGKGLGAP